MITYEIIDRQRKKIQIKNFNQITNCCQPRNWEIVWKISNKLQIVFRQGPRPLYEKVDGKAHRWGVPAAVYVSCRHFIFVCQFWVCSDLYMDGFISLISFHHLAPRKCGHQQAITNCLESQTTGSLTQLTNDHLFWRFLWLFCCASAPHLISIPGAQNQKWQTYYINLKEILSAVFILDEPSAFYAEELFEATEGLGTNDEKLQRIFVLRAEVVEWIFNFKISSGGLEKHWPCV